jgi:hypothetical protein
MLNNVFLENYINAGFDEVEGWCDPTLFRIMDFLDSAEINKVGGCLEIGIHHGKFFILLNSLIYRNFDSYAIDLFDAQESNIDQSGLGNLDAFKQNLVKFDRHQGQNTKIISGDSTDTKLITELKELVGTIRYLSIDGGHTPEHTISDLNLANTLVKNQGVVILDDILNHHWLGVIEGASIFLKTRPTLLPFAIGSNKLFLSKISYYPYYFKLFANSQFNTKIVSFFGYPIVAM